MNTLTIRPEKAGTSTVRKGHVTGVRYGAGAQMTRPTGAKPAKEITMTWICSRLEYQYMRAFYKTACAEGSRAFLLREGVPGVPADAVCRFVPGTWRLQEQRGHTYTVSATVSF